MKKVNQLFLAVLMLAAFSIASCKKCEECHYDGPNGEVELGEYCDEDLEQIEFNGQIEVDSIMYVVHCGAH